MRKLVTFDDHLFEQMKDREFFDAFFSEPCNKCIELESERDRLKGRLAELGAERFLCSECETPLKSIKRMDGKSYWVHPVYECPKTIHAQWSQELTENDRLRELAGRMAEALETIIANPVAACSDRHDIVAQEALAAFRAAKGEKEKPDVL